MPTQNVQTTNKTVDMLMVTAAILIAIGGLLAFTFLSDHTLTIRLASLAGSFIVAILIAAMSASGKQFFAYCRSSYEELRRIVWPTRKETVNTTGMVMAFVIAVAFYLFVIDKLVEWGLYDGLLKITF